MSDVFIVLEAGATEMTRYEVPMVLKPVVDGHVESMRHRIVIGPQSGKTRLLRQWLETATKTNPTAAAQIKVTKVPNGVRGHEGTVETNEVSL